MRMLSPSRMTGVVVSIAAVGALCSPVIANAGTIPPTPSIAAPSLPPSVATAIGQIEASPGVPTAVSSTLAQLVAALNGQSPPTTAQAAALLSELASTPGLPSQAAGALDQLAGTIASGTAPTPADLNGALSSLITQLAGSPGLPSQVSTSLTQLASTLSGPNPPGLDQVATILDQLAGTPGVPAEVAQGLQGLSGSIGSSGSTGGSGIPGFNGSNPFGPGFNPSGPAAGGKSNSLAVQASGIVIKSVKYNTKRHTVAVVVLCKAHATKCNTATAVYKGRTRVAGPAAKTIAAQKRATFNLRVSKRTASQIAKHGATLRATAVSNTALGRSSSAKSLRVKRTHTLRVKRTHK